MKDLVVKNRSTLLLGLGEVLILGLFFKMLQVTEAEMKNVVYVSLASLPLAAALLPFWRRVAHVGKKPAVAAALLSLLYLAMLSLPELLASERIALMGLPGKAVYLAVAAGCTWYVLLQLLSLGLTLPATAAGRFDRTKVFWFCLGLIAFVSLLCVTATDLGIWIGSDVYTVDHLVQNGIWDDWHTVGYLMFVWLVYCIKPTTGAVVLANGALWVLLNFFILRYFKKLEHGCAAMVGYTALSLFVFSPYYYNQVMYKDVVFSIGMMGSALFFLYLVNTDTPKYRTLPFGALALFFVMIFRHAGAMPVLVGAACLGVVLLKTKKFAALRLGGIALACALLGSGVLSFVGMQVLQATPTPSYVTYGTPLYMVSAAAHEGIALDEADEAIVEKVMPMEDWPSVYDKYLVDEASRTWGKIGSERIAEVERLLDEEHFGRDLLLVNAHLALRHPVFYLSHLLNPCSILWEIAQPNDGYDWALANVPTNGDPTNEDITHQASYPLVQSYADYLIASPLRHAVSWRGGFSLFFSIVSAVLLGLKRRAKDLVAFVPLLVFDLLMFLTLPAQDPRFVLETIEFSLMMVPYALCAPLRAH